MAGCQTVQDRYGTSGSGDVGQRAYLPSQLSPHRTCGGSHGQRDQCVRGEAGMSDGGGGTEASGCQGEEPRTGYGWSGGPFL